MKKIFYSVTAAALLLGTTACGGDKGTKEETAVMAADENTEADENIPATATVTVTDGKFKDGDLADYIALVPGDYTFNYSNGSAIIELKAKALTQADKTVSSDTKIVVYDEDGNELASIITYGGTSNLSKALQAGDTENEYPLTFHYHGFQTELPEFMTKAKEIKGKEAKEYNSSSSSSSSSSAGTGTVNSAELSEFVSNGTSGNIDKMIDALEWQNKAEAALKPKVRALDENAIKAAIEIDKASEKIGEKYDRYSLAGALDSMTDEMSSSQLSRYNAACSKSVLYFTASDDTSEYNNLYRKLRYGI